MTILQAIVVGFLVAAAALNAAAFLSWRRARKAWERVAERNRRTAELNRRTAELNDATSRMNEESRRLIAEGNLHLAAARKALAEEWRWLEAARSCNKEHIS